MLFGKGFQASLGVKFRHQIRNLGDGRLLADKIGEGFWPQSNLQDRMTNGVPKLPDPQYDTVVEVDG